ncbi:hypothetical protein [Natrinema salsiterrestre]|uniref:Uncharacterized protein n=1 Tax=Natrinema salsiterrestre TaxID=2950540 RepID=A0A9Q4L8D2_9EURY|nr:hypothetical protein [Natrinema salsiterrestre]MDF9748422.1 hypothetical protein [Natrinema salsiterrestre]
MPRCEACGGTIQGMHGSARPRDKCIDVSLFEFDDDVGLRTAKRTYFCSEKCAIRGIEEDMLLTQDDSLFWVDRRGEGPQLYPQPEVEPLVRRAKELLEEAAELNNCDDVLDHHLDEAIENVADAESTLEEYPDVSYRCRQAAQSALADVEDGAKAHDAVADASVEHGVPEQHGRVWGHLQDALPAEDRSGGTTDAD